MNNREIIGERLKNFRQSKNMSREEFAEYVNLSPRFIVDLEVGDKGLSVESLINICQAFNLSADYIVFGSDNSRSSPLNALFSEIPHQYRNVAEDLLKTLLKAVEISNELSN